jgi:hypothetical protein
MKKYETVKIKKRAEDYATDFAEKESTKGECEMKTKILSVIYKVLKFIEKTLREAYWKNQRNRVYNAEEVRLKNKHNSNFIPLSKKYTV